MQEVLPGDTSLLHFVVILHAVISTLKKSSCALSVHSVADWKKLLLVWKI